MTHPLCALAASGQISPVPLSAPLSTKDKRTGIYCIWMPADPKHRVYVGQAGNGAPARLVVHRWSLRKGRHHTIQLQRAYTKYGEDAFVWALVEELPADTRVLTPAEQAWMSRVGAAGLFNTDPAAGSRQGARHSEATKAKIAASGAGRVVSAETRSLLSAIHKGKTVSAETRAKLSAAQSGKRATVATRAKLSAERRTRPVSEAAVRAMQAANTGRKLTPEHVAKNAAAQRARTPEQKADAQAKFQATLARKRVIAAG